MSSRSRQVASAPAAAPAPAAPAAMPSSSASGELSPSASAASSPIDPAQALKASRALLAHLKSASAAPSSSSPKKRNLLADADPADDDSASPAAAELIWLVFAAKNHLLGSNRLKPVQLAVPHSIIDPLAAPAGALRIALIVAEPQRAMKDLVASADFPDDLRVNISRVIDYTHLGKKFKSYESQRLLFSNHDIFLADDRISNRLPKLLGTRFFKTTTKRPIPVAFYTTASRSGAGKRTGPKPRRDASRTPNLRPASEIAAEIGRACGAALVHLGPSTSTSVVIGRGSWPAEHVAANAVAVAEALTARFTPQGDWAGVSSVFIKGIATVALPVWQTDALWAQQSQVLADGPPAAGTEGGVVRAAEKANVGRKRKAISDTAGAGAPAPVVMAGPARKRKAASSADEPCADGEAVVVKKKKTGSRRTAKAVAA